MIQQQGQRRRRGSEQGWGRQRRRGLEQGPCWTHSVRNWVSGQVFPKPLWGRRALNETWYLHFMTDVFLKKGNLSRSSGAKDRLKIEVTGCSWIGRRIRDSSEWWEKGTGWAKCCHRSPGSHKVFQVSHGPCCLPGGGWGGDLHAPS